MFSVKKTTGKDALPFYNVSSHIISGIKPISHRHDHMRGPCDSIAIFQKICSRGLWVGLS